MYKGLVVVIGVSGSGKSSLAQRLAAYFQQPMIEADDYHLPQAKALMQAGHGLNEEHRKPWLHRLVVACEQALSCTPTVILACSALQQQHRDRFRRIDAPVRFIWPDVPIALLQQRLRQRTGHFASNTLLTSQFACFEPPINETDCLRIDGTLSLDTQLAECVAVMDDW
ncbi:gluconokinase, GntK/IdnK-type [Alteromonas sp. 14N.309.X.WAT.G.H12]|uniref:gluconokinase n=1 Tax=Alteromonas sp. 14N.309.X.WAT.G.H12 TaxID=3120824 RepID=UPI002FD4BBAB